MWNKVGQWHRYSFSRPQATSSVYLTAVNVLLLLAAIAVNVHLHDVKSLIRICTPKAVSTYSPIFDRLPVYHIDTTPDTTFWPKIPSIFMKPPSPEVDAAWKRYSDTSGFRLTASEARAMGKDLSTLWPWPSSDPNSEPTYVAIVDVFHQLHCLDNLRRAAWPSYYGDLKKLYANHTFPFDDHVLHCQFVLEQALTCRADLDLYTFNKIKGFKGPFPDFVYKRKCRNFEDILKWKEENDVEEAMDITKTPEGIREVPAEGRAIPWPE